MEKLVKCFNPNRIVRIITFIWVLVMLVLAAVFFFIIEERNLILGVIFALAAVIGPVRALRDFPVFYVDKIGRVYIRRFFRSEMLNKARVSERGKLTLPVYPTYAPKGFFVSIEKEGGNNREETYYILDDDHTDTAENIFRSI